MEQSTNVRPQKVKRLDKIGMWFVGWSFVAAIANPPRRFDEPQAMRALE
ncbi:MAG TPA: hypothetical protein VN950_19545 [Terriglobales bacterium]|nr:hypothetical protein [Terriglobales bacterium]